MPFEIAPKEVEAPARIGTYQHFVDALLRGCAVTGFCAAPYNKWASPPEACAMGAIAIGLGVPRNVDAIIERLDEEDLRQMNDAYLLRYGSAIRNDNDSGRFTREQIAERIAAL